MKSLKVLLVAVAFGSVGQAAFAVEALLCGGAAQSGNVQASAYFIVSAGDVISASSTTGFGGKSYYRDYSPNAQMYNSTQITATPFTFVVPDGMTEIYVNVDGYFDPPLLENAFPTSMLEPEYGLVTLSCTIGSTGSDLIGTTASTIGANSQTRAINTGIGNNASSRLGAGSSNTATKNQLFVSTQNLTRSQLETPEFNAWVSAEGRNYSGGFDGYTADMVIGADKLFSDNFLAGVLLGYGHVDIKDATSSAVVNSPAIGAYFASKVAGDLILDGYISFARPEYDTNGATFKSDRVSVALSLNGDYSTQKANIRPFARLSGYSESQPGYTGTGGAVAANDIDAYTASLGARFEASKTVGSTGMTPYLSTAVDYGYSKSTANGSDDFVAPRLGVGMSGPVGAGYLSFDLDGGKVTSDTYDVGLRATYEFNF